MKNRTEYNENGMEQANNLLVNNHTIQSQLYLKMAYTWSVSEPVLGLVKIEVLFHVCKHHDTCGFDD